MGCTSSATNMAPTNMNATEKIVEINEAAVQTVNGDIEAHSSDEESGMNEIKVLPSCDTLAEPIQLDSNNKSMINKSTLDLEKDSSLNRIRASSSDESLTEERNSQTDIKLSSLEDVVEKVVELYVADNLFLSKINTEASFKENIHADNNEQNDKGKKDEDIDKPPDDIQDMEVETNDLEGGFPEEASSPSQSTSSRATRWEALADIAAELPPSLTVDPLTGQIYALTK